MTGAREWVTRAIAAGHNPTIISSGQNVVAMRRPWNVTTVTNAVTAPNGVGDGETEKW